MCVCVWTKICVYMSWMFKSRTLTYMRSCLFNYIWTSWLSICLCTHSILFVCMHLQVGALAPLLRIRMCHVLWDVGSASPGRHLNFSPCCVIHYSVLHESVCGYTLSCSLRSLSIHLPPLSASPPQPLTPHMCTPNQSKELSRLALGKSP